MRNFLRKHHTLCSAFATTVVVFFALALYDSFFGDRRWPLRYIAYFLAHPLTLYAAFYVLAMLCAKLIYRGSTPRSLWVGPVMGVVGALLHYWAHKLVVHHREAMTLAALVPAGMVLYKAKEDDSDTRDEEHCRKVVVVEWDTVLATSTPPTSS